MTEGPDDGTRTPDDGGGNANGTQDEAARNAEAQANQGRLIAVLTEKAARANELERENATLRARQSPAAEPAEDDDPDEAAAREWAGKGDGVARFALKSEKRLRKEFEERERLLVGEIANKMEIDRIPDKAKREAVEKMFNEGRNLYGTVGVALAQYERDELAEQNRKQGEELERLRKGLAQSVKKSDPDVVRTDSREVSAGELKERIEMTGAQWAERQAELNRRRDAGDMEADKQLRREQLARRAGSIQVSG